MKILHKITLIILLFILMLFSLLLAIFSLGVVSQDFLNLVQTDIYQNYIMAGIFFIITLLAAWTIYPLLEATKKNTTLQTSEDGNVNISFQAIDKLVRSIVADQSGVETKAINLETINNRLIVELIITVEEGDMIPVVTQELKENIKNKLKTIMGADMAQVKILIENLSSPPVSKESPQEINQAAKEAEKAVEREAKEIKQQEASEKKEDQEESNQGKGFLDRFIRRDKKNEDKDEDKEETEKEKPDQVEALSVKKKNFSKEEQDQSQQDKTEEKNKNEKKDDEDKKEKK